MPDRSFTTAMAVVVTALVEHHPPCVPECPICYPPESESEQ